MTGRGRVYVPAECPARTAPRLVWIPRRSTGPGAWRWPTSGAYSRAVREGRPVCDAVRGRLRYELRATWLGGMRILDRWKR